MTRFIALKMAYNGSRFYGIAPQREVATIVGALDAALGSLGIKSQILIAGRTDRGVHATGQILRLEVPCFWDLLRLKNLLNQKLYPYIRVRKIYEVGSDFNPRFDALSREYCYIFTSHLSNLYLSDFITQVKIGDEKLLRVALGMFAGRHDFRFFQKTRSDQKSTIREIYQIRLRRRRIFKENVWVASFVANGFLYAQIRLIMGAALACSRQEISLEELGLQLLAKQRFFSLPSPPNGLYLTHVQYPKHTLRNGV